MKSAWWLALLAFVGAPLLAEPTGRWWSGGAMGVAEYGYTMDDDTYLLISCGDGYSRTTIMTSIGGQEPSYESVVTFEVDGEAIEMWRDKEGVIGTSSRVDASNFEYLIERLKAGNSLTVRFDGLSQTYPLSGSAAALRYADECVPDYAR